MAPAGLNFLLPRAALSFRSFKRILKMKRTCETLCTLWVALFLTQFPQSSEALELSEPFLSIVTQDYVAPAMGTLELLSLSNELPPEAVTVAGAYSPGNVVLRVRAALSTGAVFSLTGVVEGADSQPGAWDFCCITGSGYIANSERIPGPDEFWPWIWNWFFDDPADPGLLAAGEHADLWVSFTELEPGNRILFFASGPSPAPCQGGACEPFGTVTVLPDSVPVLGPRATLILLVLLCVIALSFGGWFAAQKPDFF